MWLHFRSSMKRDILAIMILSLKIQWAQNMSMQWNMSKISKWIQKLQKRMLKMMIQHSIWRGDLQENLVLLWINEILQILPFQHKEFHQIQNLHWDKSAWRAKFQVNHPPTEQPLLWNPTHQLSEEVFIDIFVINKSKRKIKIILQLYWNKQMEFFCWKHTPFVFSLYQFYNSPIHHPSFHSRLGTIVAAHSWNLKLCQWVHFFKVVGWFQTDSHFNVILLLSDLKSCFLLSECCFDFLSDYLLVFWVIPTIFPALILAAWFFFHSPPFIFSYDSILISILYLK